MPLPTEVEEGYQLNFEGFPVKGARFSIAAVNGAVHGEPAEYGDIREFRIKAFCVGSQHRGSPKFEDGEVTRGDLMRTDNFVCLEATPIT